MKKNTIQNILYRKVLNMNRWHRIMLYRKCYIGKVCTGKCFTENTRQGKFVQEMLHKKMLYRKCRCVLIIGTQEENVHLARFN